VAILRLFAQAREAAGAGTANFSGSTVDDVIQAAISQYGATFEAVVNMSKVWVNGEEVPRSHAVTDKDEVAVLPPVSGGM
jgi:molybdopterin synthase sulfur carrier subunit